MKKLILVISVLLLLMLPLFADDPTNPAEIEVTPKNWKPTTTGQSTTSDFWVTFEGSEKGVLYSDIGFSKIATTIGSTGIIKTAIENNAITMTHANAYGFSDNAYTYSSSVYVYWYCSFNKAKFLKLTVSPSSGCAVTLKYTPYTYAISSESLDTSGTVGTQLQAKADNTEKPETGTTTKTTVKLAYFGPAIAVYHGNSEIIFEATVEKYPTNGVIGSVVLTLEETE